MTDNWFKRKFQNGDMVVAKRPLDTVSRALSPRWTSSMDQYHDKKGEVYSANFFESDSYWRYEVRFEDGYAYHFRESWLEPTPNICFEVDDIVIVRDVDKEDIDKTPYWADGMDDFIGKRAVVTKVRESSNGIHLKLQLEHEPYDWFYFHADWVKPLRETREERSSITYDTLPKSAWHDPDHPLNKTR